MVKATLILFLFIAFATFAPADDFQKDIPEAATLSVARSKDFRSRKQLDVAEKTLREVLATYPDYYKARYELGLVYQDRSDYTAAIRELESARTIREKQNLPEYSIYNTLGWVYMLTGLNERAEENYLTALNYESKNTPESNRRLYNNIAWFYYTLGKAGEARKYVDIATEKYQSDSAVELKKLIEQLAVDKQRINVSIDQSETPGQYAYRGKVGPYDATFFVRFEPDGHVSGTYSMTVDKNLMLRLDGRLVKRRLTFDEYTHDRLTARIDLSFNRSSNEIRWEGTMYNAPPDNRVFPVVLSRPK